jgi:hypothetical protein
MMGARRLNEGADEVALEPPLPGRPFDVEVFPALDRSWPADGLGPVATIIAQLPDPKELAPGAIVVVHPYGKPTGAISRWLGFARRTAHPSVRCTALLARGFKAIGGAPDPKTREDLTWGVA